LIRDRVKWAALVGTLVVGALIALWGTMLFIAVTCR